MVLLAALTIGAPPATAGPSAPEPYATAVRLVDRLFLEPETVNEVALLHSAARRLEADIHWLRVVPSARAVTLEHGDGTVIGRVEVAGMDDVPRALQALEDVLVASGHDLDGANVGLSVLSGMADALDRYSRVLAEERLDRFNVRLTGTLVGIGATFRIEKDGMVVAFVGEDGPAAEGGLKVGDQVQRIDGRSTLNMPLSEATRRVRGEEGTQVTLSLLRGDAEVSLALTRAEVVVPNITHRVLEGRIGYVHVDHVSQRTVENLRKALLDLQEQGALDRGLVIDLRGNTGGSMKEAARAADQFLDQGLLLRTVGKDGGRVQNLQAEMRAGDDGTEPQIPVVLVVDRKTASGAEIMAGALVELGRAASVGTRTYGKGTVQKIYNLEDDVRLKLTVARYILANDRQIAQGGLLPDILVGQVRLDGYGMRLRDWDEDRLLVPWERVIPEVHETAGWRGKDDVTDLALELARRSVASATGTSRQAVVEQLERHAVTLRRQQETRLHEALAARSIDWAPAPEDGTFIEAYVDVKAERVEGDTYQVSVEVRNDGPDPLHRALVQLSCASSTYWDGVVLPVGRVAPGETATGEVRVGLAPGIALREDAVEVRLRADKRPPLMVSDFILRSESSDVPRIRLEARLVPHGDDLGPHGHPIKRAEVTVHNLSRGSLHGLEVHFGYPDEEHIELLDHGARTSLVAGHDDERLDLAMEVSPTAPLVLPLNVVLDSERHRRIADWPLVLPTMGDSVVLEAPRIEVSQVGPSAPVGPSRVPIRVLDDRAIEYVVVWANGEKVAWAPGAAKRVELTPTIAVLPGDNRISVYTRDDQGLRTRHRMSIRGVAPAAVDADGAEPEER